MDHIVPPFEFAGHEIGCTIAELDPDVELNLENVLGGSAGLGGRGATGSAKMVVLRNALKRVTVDGQNRALFHRDTDGAEIFRPPNIREKTGKRRSLQERVIFEAVKINDWLGFDDRFSPIFAPYLPEEDLDGDGEPENPTPETPSSSDTPGSEGSGESPAP